MILIAPIMVHFCDVVCDVTSLELPRFAPKRYSRAFLSHGMEIRINSGF